MISYLDFDDIIDLHGKIVRTSGGALGIRDEAGIKSALELPRMTAFGTELYPTLAKKAAIIGFSMIMNHPL
jgi:death on curing protein